MSQLQWEAKQISPRKDELVERYLEEKDEHGSQIRDAYRELKQELNMFRHYHWKVKYNKVMYLPEYRFYFFIDLIISLKEGAWDHNTSVALPFLLK